MTPADPSTAAVLSEALGAPVQLRDSGGQGSQVLAPLSFPDGDHLVIYLRRLPARRYRFSDGGHTYMHLSYGIDVDAFRSGPQAARARSLLSLAGVRDDDGELSAQADERSLAATFLEYAQVLIEVSALAAKDAA